VALDAKSILAETALFGQLSDRSLEQLAATAVQYTFNKDRVIYFQGEPSQRRYVLASGAVKLRVSSSDGLSWVPDVLVPPATFGMLGLAEGVYTTTAEAFTDSTVLVLPGSSLLNIVKPGVDRETVKDGLLQAAIDQVNRLLQQAADLACCSLPQLLAKILLRLAEQAGIPDEEGGIRIALPLTQQDLAEFAGSARITVNQILRGMEHRGWVERTRTRELILVKPDQLKEYASR
jgi:CRP/FNR family cyclic AMP-dependent transcriptional regulator